MARVKGVSGQKSETEDSLLRLSALSFAHVVGAVCVWRARVRARARVRVRARVCVEGGGYLDRRAR